MEFVGSSTFGHLVEGSKSRQFDLNLNAGLDLNIDAFEECNGRRGELKLSGFDLNKTAVSEEIFGRNNKIIDLNMAVRDNYVNFTTEGKGRGFDLNESLMKDESEDSYDGEGLGVCAKKIVVATCGESSQNVMLPPKPHLPSSSRDLDIKGVSPFDVLSVFAFLRSFSIFLFLSPFELHDFVDSVISTDSTLLFDSIHVSLLRTLMKHVEFPDLKEGSVSSKKCLQCDVKACKTHVYSEADKRGGREGLKHRTLNSEFLDLITWPMFLLQYMLLHSHSLTSCHSEIIQDNFYKLPVSSKVEILRLLCDDVMETEVFGSFICQRTLALEVQDKSSKGKFVNFSGDEPGDCNGEECCLCNMGGNLLCCDGCPEAFHSRCVGVVTNLLPEGDWYCPECVIEKDNPWMQLRKSIRGAELVGMDSYGRLYHGSCGFLLVSESLDNGYTFWSYNRNDLTAVIEALHSIPFLNATLISDICKQWNIVLETESQGMTLENPVAITEGSSEVSDALITTNTVKESNLAVNTEDDSMSSNTLDIQQSNNPNCANNTCVSAAIHSRASVSELCSERNYVNYYEFAQISSSVSVEFKKIENGPYSVEQIISRQMKVLSGKYADFSWSNIRNPRLYKKERCGWCVCCQAPREDVECVFILNNKILNVENLGSEALGTGLRRQNKNHLVDVRWHMICIEDRLQGLLLGPWLNPQYSALWREMVAGVTDIVSLKILLLKLESNLHHLALSADWQKHVDSSNKAGSACHIVRRSAGVFLKHKSSLNSSWVGVSPSWNSDSGLRLLWWRGGKGSRKLFNWKGLPHSLASKAARQGGCKQIPGILYPNRGDFAKITKCVTWRAAVETSRSIAQFALQIRDLNANIRWSDIENTNFLFKTEEGSKKAAGSFKNVKVRNKSSEKTVVKYLLDFGKKRVIPKDVLKHGSIFEDTANQKKKRYLLEESHVPLHLLKAFEAKMIYRKSNKLSSQKPSETSTVKKKPLKRDIFSYLFSKAEAERLENHQGGHCDQNIIIRDAVSCQYCNGIFEKEHVEPSPRPTNDLSVYTCDKCQSEMLMKTNAIEDVPEIMMNSEIEDGVKNEVPIALPLRRSARYNMCVSKLSQLNKLKKHKTKKRSSCKSSSSYWLNGLRLLRRPNVQKLMHFRSMVLLLYREVNNEPKCSLCGEMEHSSTLHYVACETCGVWFHGDAVGLTDDKIQIIIGFNCHKCLNKRPPQCPYQ